MKRNLISGLIVASPIIALLIASFFIDVLPSMKASEPTVVTYVAEPYSSSAPSEQWDGHYEFETYTVKSSAVLRTTAYCSCEKCCGWSTGITYSGTTATAGRTIGANLDEYPLGTKLLIDGNIYIVEDTGNLGFGTIDIYMDSHEEALQYGVKYVNAEVIN
jgi:3D (Asp-Asp-Asp) domain-containing protein